MPKHRDSKGFCTWPERTPTILALKTIVITLPMIKLKKSIDRWGTDTFNKTLKEEIESLDAEQLFLQQALSASSYVTDTDFSVMIISVSESADTISAKAGVFFSGIIAGCSCADDPTPVDEQNEYCELLFDINKETADTSVKLLGGDY